MWIWIVAGIMGFLVLVELIVLIVGLTRKGGFSLQRGKRPEKRKEYGSTYQLQRGRHQKRRQLNDRTGRLQRGSRPKRRPEINLDE
jgi:hypothetical protein